MFDLIVNRFGFLKHVPFLPHLFDAVLKATTYFTNRRILDYVDEIESEVMTWQNTSISFHKYGGIQFDAHQKEIGHIHGNGLLDVLFSREIKMQCIKAGRVQEHHVFKDSGWISLWVKNDDDKNLAVELLRRSYAGRVQHNSQSVIRNP
jgi:hypothetical protein